jgi:NitT/TauT family transport system ATP-binding protein
MSREIAIDHISKTFLGPAGQCVDALMPVTLTVQAGEFFSLIGPSGCGKTTLLRLIAGLIETTSGQVIIGSHPMRRPDRRVAFVFQRPTLLPWRTVLRNCLLPVELSSPDRLAAAHERARELLSLTGLADFADSYPDELSGGMQQRAAIVRALVSEPEVLLMDEPFSALDEFTRERLQEDLLRLQAQYGQTVVFVTHNIGEAVFLSDRVGIMAPRPGRLGAVLDLGELPKRRDAELRRAPIYFSKLAEARAAFDQLLQ